MMKRRTGRGARSFRITLWILAVALAWAPVADARGGGFKQAPPLRLRGLDGKLIDVKYADARVTLVNFWATWCLPCREEMPAINRIFQKYRDRGFRAVGLALQSGDPSEVKEFLDSRKMDLTYPILLSTEDLAEAYGDIEILPTTYLIGPGGEVLKTFFGLAGDFERTLGGEIEKLLSPPPSVQAPVKKN